ncbi:MAG: bifunctional isocitrate dehydrogenase kinase/phosphatase, partial [Candidatus Thermofonsia Clade 1 bacterium]
MQRETIFAIPERPSLLPAEPFKRSLAHHAASAIHSAFEDYHTAFKAITHRAQERFERREWTKWQNDSIERLELREQIIRRLVHGLRTMLGEQVN